MPCKVVAVRNQNNVVRIMQHKTHIYGLDYYWLVCGSLHLITNTFLSQKCHFEIVLSSYELYIK